MKNIFFLKWEYVLDEIEEGAEVGIAGVLGELFISFCQLGKEGEDFIRG